MDPRYVISGPVIEVGIELNTPLERKVLTTRLSLASQDLSFAYSLDDDSGPILLRGQSEDHLDGIVQALRVRSFDITAGTPQVFYRECLVRPVDVDATYKWPRGGKGDFARVILRLEPGDPDSDATFVSQAGDAVPREYLPGVIEALAAFKRNGLLAGYPLIGFKATLVGGAYHEVDSSIFAFETATRNALQVIKDKGAIALVEPVMALEVSVSQEFRDAVVRDLSARDGTIDVSASAVKALVPLATVLGYRSRLARLTNGSGAFVMRYSHHAIVLHSDDPDRFGPAAAMRLQV